MSDSPTSAASAPVVDRLVKFVTSDGKEMLILRSICAMSVTLDNIFKDLGLDDSPETNEEPIPIMNVDEATMKKILAWCEHQQTDPSSGNELSSWETTFFKVDKKIIFEIILAANYLNIPRLTDAGCIAIGLLMKGKTTEQLREEFEVDNDFTPEEEADIRGENAWSND